MDKMYTMEWLRDHVPYRASGRQRRGCPQDQGREKAGRNLLISGSKIFISAGDHDLAENIIHMVLARVEGAPPGTKRYQHLRCPKYGSKTAASCTTTLTAWQLNISWESTLRPQPP